VAYFFTDLLMHLSVRIFQKELFFSRSTSLILVEYVYFQSETVRLNLRFICCCIYF